MPLRRLWPLRNLPDKGTAKLLTLGENDYILAPMNTLTIRRRRFTLPLWAPRG